MPIHSSQSPAKQSPDKQPTHTPRSAAPAPPLLLIVEDEATQLRLLEKVVERAGWRFESLTDGRDAAKRLLDTHAPTPDAVLLDQGLPGLSGIQVLETIRPRLPDLPVIMLTAQSSIRIVVDAMRAGANDFIVKPASAERIRTALVASQETSSLVGEIALGQKNSSTGSSSSHHMPDPKEAFASLIGSSPATIAAKALALKAAASTIPVLLDGESGVGKEVFARAIHRASNRADKPFVAVNCGAIPENLVESILFGHEKGAFTGATERRLGKFQEAAGGTLFLDEIGELPLDVQVKLLRALQEREIDPVGAHKSIPVDIRVISATNRSLADQVSEGHFREDLYYRLHVFPIHLPSLRERRDDIPALTDHFLDLLSKMEDIPRKQAGPHIKTYLQHYHWPGNVRQLQNALFRAVILSDSAELSAEDFRQVIEANASGPQNTAVSPPVTVSPATGLLPATSTLQSDPEIASQADSLPLFNAVGHIRPLAEIEAEVIRTALGHYKGRMSEVARQLGIGRSTLYRKVTDYGLEEDAK